MWYDKLLERELVPDFLIRQQIRGLLRSRIRALQQPDEETLHAHIRNFVNELSESPIAIHTEDANEQHYELPTSFFQYVLGPHMKYSCGWWESGAESLEQSEDDMLQLTCFRAELKNGHQILELGCGWGSLSLYMASRYPDSEIIAVSNSATQKLHIDRMAHQRGITNLKVITADINDFYTTRQFDRVISVEMFEHMRNYKLLMRRISSWLNPSGKLFIHIFTHHKYTYKFEVKDDTDWMSKYFFTGGIMPSNDLLFYFNEDLVKEKQWLVNGENYQKTSECWLKNMDKHRQDILPILGGTYGADKASLWFAYWRIFFMSCAELWGYQNGQEWMVSHYLFKPRK